MKTMLSTIIAVFAAGLIVAGLIGSGRIGGDGEKNQVAPSNVAAPVSTVAASQSLASSDIMEIAGSRMIAVADEMETVAKTLTAEGDPGLAAIAQHWASDAQVLRERADWLVASISASSMVHDPDQAHQLNLFNLGANGSVMVAEGQELIVHGQEMVGEVEQLKRDGTISAEMASELSQRTEALITTGEALQQDGERMQEDAGSLLKSLGQ